MDEEHLDAQIRIPNPHEEYLLRVVELQVVIPQVTDQRRDLLLQLTLLDDGGEGVQVLGDCQLFFLLFHALLPPFWTFPLDFIESL